METSQVFSKEHGSEAGGHHGWSSWQSCTAPKSGLVELGNWCNAKIVQISCVEACVLRLPGSGLFGFSCLVVVVNSAGQDVLLDLNGHEVKTCLDGVGSVGVGSVGGDGNGGSVEGMVEGSLLVSPAIGTRLEIRCDGQSWFVFSDYSRSLPLAAVTAFYGYHYGVLQHSETLVSPTPCPESSVHVRFYGLKKCKIYKIVNAQTTKLLYLRDYSIPRNHRHFIQSIISNANDNSIASINASKEPRLGAFNSNDANDLPAIGDSFLLVDSGSQELFLCGSTFGNVEI
jgi:hypothetical protein